jgi:hypothetical protein
MYLSGGVKDNAPLADLLQGRKVLGAFCGHLHRTFSARLADFPVYHTGAFCGAWESGPCLDGTPKGFRFIHIKNGLMKTAYTNREGRYPLYVASPTGTVEQTTPTQSGKIEIEVVAVDFGTGPARTLGKLGWRGKGFCGRIVSCHLYLLHERILDALDWRSRCG